MAEALHHRHSFQDRRRHLAGVGRTVTSLPRFLLSTLIWLFSRTEGVRDLGEFGPSEPRAMIDAMTLTAPGQTKHLLAIRP